MLFTILILSGNEDVRTKGKNERNAVKSSADSEGACQQLTSHGVAIVVQQKINITSIHENTGLIPGLAQ